MTDERRAQNDEEVAVQRSFNYFTQTGVLFCSRLFELRAHAIYTLRITVSLHKSLTGNCDILKRAHAMCPYGLTRYCIFHPCFNANDPSIRPLRNHRFFPSVILNEAKPSEESRLKRDSSPAFGGLRMPDEKGSE